MDEDIYLDNNSEFVKTKRKILPIYFKENKDALKATQFPAGEPNIELDYNFIVESGIATLKVIYPYNPVVLDVMFTLLDIIKKTKTKVIIDIPYLPYARADRNIKVDGKDRIPMVKKFLNRLFGEYDDIIIEVNTDSIHCVDILPNYDKLFNNEKIFSYLNSDDYDFIIFPDDGMYMRYNIFYRSRGIIDKKNIDDKIIVFNKERSDNSVKFLKYEFIHSDINMDDLKDKKCIIVDDIIDGGATIEEMAKVLKSYTDEIYAFTVHGIFSGKKGFKLDNIKDVKYIYNYLHHK